MRRAGNQQYDQRCRNRPEQQYRDRHRDPFGHPGFRNMPVKPEAGDNRQCRQAGRRHQIQSQLVDHQTREQKQRNTGQTGQNHRAPTAVFLLLNGLV